MWKGEKRNNNKAYIRRTREGKREKEKDQEKNEKGQRHLLLIVEEFLKSFERRKGIRDANGMRRQRSVIRQNKET